MSDSRHPDSAFMGLTHALSALAIVMVMLAFYPHIVDSYIQTKAFTIILALSFMGAVMVNDADNTSARVISDLGVLGVALSVFFRSTSRVAQTVIRTSKDDPDPNPHRGLWHSLIGCALMSLLVYPLSWIPGSFDVLGRTYTGATVAFGLLAIVLTHLVYSVLLKRALDSFKRESIVGRLVSPALATGTILVASAYCSQQDLENSVYVAYALGFGATLHAFGDSFTKWGSPLLFPLPALIGKKVWYTISFLPIGAGGAVETYVIAPMFAIVSAICAIYLIV